MHVKLCFCHAHEMMLSMLEQCTECLLTNDLPPGVMLAEPPSIGELGTPSDAQLDEETGLLQPDRACS